jgi:cytochrome c553
MPESGFSKAIHKSACLLAIVCILALFHAHAFAREAVPDTIAQRAAACFACHGKEGRATSEGYFPRIAGKPAGYLYNQLVNFRDGRRHSAPMVYMVQYMSDQYMQELAEYFSSQHPPYALPQASGVSQSVLEHGRRLVMEGDKARNIPACVACHGERLTGVLPSIPSLVGLSRDYLESQFGAWRTGMRQAIAPDCMGEVARRLTADDINAVTSWLGSHPIPDDMSPAAAGSIKPPVACGSVPQKQ